MSVRYTTDADTVPNLQQLGSTRLQSALLAGQAVDATGMMQGNGITRDQRQLRKKFDKLAENLEKCARARVAKDEEIKHLKEELAKCAEALGAQSNQTTQILRRGQSNLHHDALREYHTSPPVIINDLNKFLAEQRRKSEGSQ